MSAQGATVETPSVGSVLINMVPDNVAAAFANGAYLQVLIFAVIFGLAISFLRDSKDDTIKEAVMAVYRFCYGGVRTMFTITKWVLEYTSNRNFCVNRYAFCATRHKGNWLCCNVDISLLYWLCRSAFCYIGRYIGCF